VDTHGPERSAAWRYGFAISAVALATALTWVSQFAGLRHPSTAFLAAIVVAGWSAGPGPAVVATALSLLVYELLPLTPASESALVERIPRFLWFALFALLAARFSVARQRANRLLRQAHDDLERQVEARTAELRRTHAYLTEAERLTHTGSWAADATSHAVLYWSEEMYRICGLDPAAGLPSRDAVAQLSHPDDRARSRERIERAIGERSDQELSHRVVRGDGTVRHLQSVIHPVVDASGEVTQLVGTTVDVTERKRGARALRRARERALGARFTAVLEERTRLARDIHDTLLQGFTGVALQLVAAINRMTLAGQASSELRDVVGLAQKTLTDARRAVWDLRSPALAAGDLAAALRSTAEDSVHGTGLVLTCETAGLPQAVGHEVEEVALRVVQEAIANVVKHAGARAVRVRLEFEPRGMRLTVADDGRGFTVEPDTHTYGGHWGLLGMRERAARIGATLSVRSAPGEGTEIVLAAPYSTVGAAPGLRT
jgi:PAS domain S-box-containing protein